MSSVGKGGDEEEDRETKLRRTRERPTVSAKSGARGSGGSLGALVVGVAQLALASATDLRTISGACLRTYLVPAACYFAKACILAGQEYNKKVVARRKDLAEFLLGSDMTGMRMGGGTSESIRQAT